MSWANPFSYYVRTSNKLQYIFQSANLHPIGIPKSRSLNWRHLMVYYDIGMIMIWYHAMISYVMSCHDIVCVMMSPWGWRALFWRSTGATLFPNGVMISVYIYDVMPWYRMRCHAMITYYYACHAMITAYHSAIKS